jgi:hypothetical protein
LTEQGGRALRLTKQGRALRLTKQGGPGRGGLMPNGRMSYLGPLERRAEWSPAQKVLTRHKNGANAPRILIINEL